MYVYLEIIIEDPNNDFCLGLPLMFCFFVMTSNMIGSVCYFYKSTYVKKICKFVNNLSQD